ncbi:MAG: hypothetical protein F6K31_02525 [Symploca sp. SIO2G7]|nr:hypothetical protein [Symploca sp. SIO2G7]
MNFVLSISEFVNQANFPTHWNEADLQDYIAQTLYDKGSKNIWLEVNCAGGRADIITPKEIYEVKRFLTRANIYQAKGQIECYRHNVPAKFGNKHKCYIIGFKPNRTTEEARQAETTAWYVEKSSDIKVIFINCDRNFFPFQSNSQGLFPSLLDFKLRDLSRFFDFRLPNILPDFKVGLILTLTLLVIASGTISYFSASSKLCGRQEAGGRRQELGSRR